MSLILSLFALHWKAKEREICLHTPVNIIENVQKEIIKC